MGRVVERPYGGAGEIRGRVSSGATASRVGIAVRAAIRRRRGGVGPRGRARTLVIGGGVAGLVSAQTLSGCFGAVTLIERDRLQEVAGPRRGIPQAPHQHLLLARGRMALEALFPGLEEEILAAGTRPLDVAEELAWLTPAGWAPRFRSGITILPCRRDLLEWRLRERVRRNPAIDILDGHEVVGLLCDAAGDVVGVQARAAERRQAAGREIRADLVVDASGRGSRLPRWLEGIGVTVPQETVVDAHVVYTSRLFDGLPALPSGLRGAFIQAAPPAFTRGAAMLPVEGERTLVTLISRGGEDPPSDEAGFLTFAETLRSTLISEAIAGLRPLSPIATSRATRNRRHSYERVRAWPDGLVALGDAVCAFNPVYGQGMTCAILGAAALGALLSERQGCSIGLGRRFQRRLAHIIDAPWLVDTALDRRVSGASGPSPGPRMRARQAYLSRVGRLGTRRRDVRLASLRVAHMLSGPRSLLRPGIALRVAAQAAGEHAARARGVSSPGPTTVRGPAGSDPSDARRGSP
jgi:2-polyprenyl-6-methoxyphenol hydroxylase-like FAD-dependent oxidoreductase